jgi:hypothetical protein
VKLHTSISLVSSWRGTELSTKTTFTFKKTSTGDNRICISVEISTVFAVTVLSSMRLHKLIKRMCDWYYPDRSEYFHGT